MIIFIYFIEIGENVSEMKVDLMEVKDGSRELRQEIIAVEDEVNCEQLELKDISQTATATLPSKWLELYFILMLKSSFYTEKRQLE